MTPRERLLRRVLAPGEVLLTPGEVQIIFRISERTLRKWAQNGRLPEALRTVGNHRRYKSTDVKKLLEERTV